MRINGLSNRWVIRSLRLFTAGCAAALSLLAAHGYPQSERS